ncbi:M48 family metallopeptidase [Sulfitobacter sp. F26169L]|uniref:M48 family metallopeptidase n=1 Tax=Sulfitobacter sp. F26169L TaxID=2996015 RepID=UPI00226091C6|nr:M48 family metallopeptidase [Sulfitobacter sp. F26169L]MCX7567191.1 M48 family metallopeptidase [Sulfitobacter sp. F26169L]
MTRAFLALGFVAALAACEVTPVSPAGPGQATTPPQTSAPSARTNARSFLRVVSRVEPVAERECRARTQNVNCDFNIVVDDRPGQPANAYQTLDRQGRPIIAFTLALIGDARNEDELAFVLGHEAAHHIAGHIGRQQQNAVAGAVIFAGLATLSGGDASAVESAQRLGAQVGARTYSKNFELEADALGTVITKKAGYDPLRGAEFFTRIPDPGDKFLGSHPPNASRIDTVRRTAAGL